MRITIAQLNYKIGDFKGNFARIHKVIKDFAAKSDVIIFTELCLSGYYPKDLILLTGFMAEQEEVLLQIQALTQQYPVAVVIGLVDKNPNKGQPFHNSLKIIKAGKCLFTYHKRLLPVYNIFNEARHFAQGALPGIYEFEDVRFGFLICEDGWAGLDNYRYPGNPVDDLAKEPLDAIICINGSPSNVGKQQERINHFSAIARRCKAPLIFTNQIGGNDDIVFDGASFILDAKGELQGNLAAFREDCGTFSLEKNQLKLIAGFSATLPQPDIEIFYQQTLLGLTDYVSKSGFRQVVIGISGGIDSALTLALAVKAIGCENVFGLLMPSRYSSKESIVDAQKLCDTFKVKYYIVSIEEEFTFALKNFSNIYQVTPSSLTEQNMQARIRGRYLMEYSNQTGALVLSTGNKSELSVGYTTLYGDMTGGFNLIGDLYKTDVYQLSDYFNQKNPATPIPKEIIKKIPSAELAMDQKDSDTLPEYAVLDPMLKLYIEGDLLPPKEMASYQTLLKSVPASLIQHIHQMVDKAEFKRRQSAPIVRLQRRAFGYGRQLPIAATYPKIK